MPLDFLFLFPYDAFCARSDNQVAENFFKKYKDQVEKGGLRSIGSVLAETKKLLEFHSAHERPGNELEFKFQPAVDKALWKEVHRLHPKTMALAHSLQGKPAQSRVGALSQEGIVTTFPLFVWC